jgi:hypothetical protein
MKCIPYPGDPTGACKECVRRGRECGPRTWPKRTTRRERPRSKSPDGRSPSVDSTPPTENVPQDSRLANLEALVNELKLMLSSRGPVSSEFTTPYLIVLLLLMSSSVVKSDYDQHIDRIEWVDRSGSEAAFISVDGNPTTQWFPGDLNNFSFPSSDIPWPTFSNNLSSTSSTWTDLSYDTPSYNTPTDPLCLNPFTTNQGVTYSRPDFAKIAEVVSFATPQFTGPVTIFLDSHFQSAGAHITNLHATTFNFLPSQVIPWLVVEWTENDETDVLAIFKVEYNGLLSHLRHYGTRSGCQVNGKRWQRCFLQWLVHRIEYLKELFIALQHVVELLSGKEEDILKLCETALMFGREEEYVPL